MFYFIFSNEWPSIMSYLSIEYSFTFKMILICPHLSVIKKNAFGQRNQSFFHDMILISLSHFFIVIIKGCDKSVCINEAELTFVSFVTAARNVARFVANKD